MAEVTVVDVLNIAFESDPNAIHSLICNRVPCNKFLADDKFVQVAAPPVLEGEHYQVGALGLVNAVLAALNEPLVAVRYSDKDTDGRSKILGFCRYEPATPGASE